MEQHSERGGGGEEVGLRSYLDSSAVTRAIQSRCFKAFAISLHTHKVGVHYSGGIACPGQLIKSLCSGSLLPPKPIVKLSKQTGRKPPPFEGAAGGRVQQEIRSLLQKSFVLRGSMNVIDLNSGIPAHTCRTFRQRRSGERHSERICDDFFCLFYENPLS